MAELPSTARVVVIGGGAVGVSALYHLALAGWTDCLLLEKNELTSGSTWHAAGNCPTFSASWSVMNMQRYSTELYRGLGEKAGYPMNYHVTGSVRLGHSRQRMQEFARVVGMGRYQGMALELLGVSDIRDRYPFVETHELEGALFDPNDGDIDPAQLTQALAKGARDLGATILRFCPVTGARREAGEWVLSTPQGEVRCEVVVNAAGYRAREIGRLFGRDVPIVSMSHQYLLTDPIPALEEWTKTNGRKLPLLRDVDSSYYLRQEKTGFNLGPYEKNCRAHWVEPGDPMPEDFSFQLFPDDLDRLEWYIEDAMKRVPLLGSVGVSRVINGPIPYAPDGNPLIGPMPGVPNAFECCGFTFGIVQAGGAGKVLAEWVIEGGTEWDMWSCDPRRFGAWVDQDYTRAKAIETYGHEYAMHFPRHFWPAGRPKRVSTVTERLRKAGAQFGAYNGWERALWYAEAGDDTSEAATQSWERAGPWEPRIRAECLAVRDAVGILELPGFSRFEVSGRGATDWLRGLAAGAIARPGRIGLLYFADARGRLLTEMTILRLAEDRFQLITAAVAQGHDRAWLDRHLPADGSIAITDLTEEVDTLIVTGPRARALLAEMSGADLDAPWLTHQEAFIAGHEARLVRVSFAGELGWELHVPMEAADDVYDAVIDHGRRHGLRRFGMFALDSLRLEKGYKTWKGDLSTDYTPLELGLERFVALDGQNDFVGKAALLAERARGPRKKSATLVVDAGAADAPYMSTVWLGDRIVGETTSGGWGYRVEKSIALAMVAADAAQPGARLEVEIFGERRPAVVQPGPALWDPSNERLRA